MHYITNPPGPGASSCWSSHNVIPNEHEKKEMTLDFSEIIKAFKEGSRISGNLSVEGGSQKITGTIAKLEALAREGYFSVVVKDDHRGEVYGVVYAYGDIPAPSTSHTRHLTPGSPPPSLQHLRTRRTQGLY